jgi:SAM-dependent methyltransferase
LATAHMFLLSKKNMSHRRISGDKKDTTADKVRDFYNSHPYPPPVNNLEDYRRRWQDEIRRRADYHLFWPEKPYRENIEILVAGCGTSQAAKYALREPNSHIIGIDFSLSSIEHTRELKQKYKLSNLEVHQIPLERVSDLGLTFDKIVCTGVLHHLPDPGSGLRALREVLKMEGALNLMVYAPYGRAGVYLIQEYCRRLGIGSTDLEIRDLAGTLTALPMSHPLARLLGESPDFQRKDALADALLNPQDRAYSVPQLFDLLSFAGLRFGHWVRQAPYSPRCGSIAGTPHASRLQNLDFPEQYAQMELFRGTMLRHNLIACRDDHPRGYRLLDFDSEGWLEYIPLRVLEAVTKQGKTPNKGAAILINTAHTDPDLIFPIDDLQIQMVDLIDGKRSIREIIADSFPPGKGPGASEIIAIRNFFEMLSLYDQVIFRMNGSD